MGVNKKPVSQDRVKQAKYRLSRETGTIIKDWGGRIPIALIYPNSYYLGMSNLGIHAIYSLLNSYPEVVCERAFWEKENKTERLPTLCLESQRPLSDFAVLAFSISYELDYFNVVQILKASGIPLYAADRDERHPLVIAGGPCIIANPMPLSPFFDCLCIGEAEPILPAMLPVLSDGIEGRRDELLKVLASLPGVYVPQCYDGIPVVRQWAANLDDFPVNSTILTPDTELGNLYLIEVERGCNWGCRFCLVSNAFYPMRFRSIDKLIAQAELGLQYRKRLGLVGPAVSDHPQFEELLTKLNQMGAELSISSLRVKPLPQIALREMAKGGARTIALAPEAGSQRLRQVIKKGISEDDILESMYKVAEQGIKQIKLYFMIGLPSETDDDIEEITKTNPQSKVLVLTQYDDSEYIYRFLKAGAAGYVLKKAVGTDLVSAIRAVSQGKSYIDSAIADRVIKGYLEHPESAGGETPYDYLSDREKTVFKLVAEGYTSRQIADTLILSIKTVMTHRANIMEKLGFHNRAELIKYAIRQGLISSDS
ncbi:radical SAM protein [Chloroflexota bacterium]